MEDSKYTTCPYCGQTIRKHSVLCEHCKRILDSRVARHRDMQKHKDRKKDPSRKNRNFISYRSDYGESSTGPAGVPACDICSRWEKDTDCRNCFTWNRTLIMLLSESNKIENPEKDEE